jgi:hypothetical protein
VSDFVSEKIFTISFWPPGSQYWLMFYSETTNYISRYRLNFSNEITGLWNLSRYRYQPSEVAKNLGWPNDIKYTVRPNLLFAICFSGLTSVYDYLSLNVKYKFTLEIACGDWISRIYSEPNWTRFNPNGNNHTYSERWYDGEVGH